MLSQIYLSHKQLSSLLLQGETFVPAYLKLCWNKSKAYDVLNVFGYVRPKFLWYDETIFHPRCYNITASYIKDVGFQFPLHFHYFASNRVKPSTYTFSFITPPYDVFLLLYLVISNEGHTWALEKVMNSVLTINKKQCWQSIT